MSFGCRAVLGLLVSAAAVGCVVRIVNVPIVARTVAVDVYVRRPVVVVCKFVEPEHRTCGGESAREVVVRHTVVADTGIEFVVILTSEIEISIAYLPAELVVLILVGAVVVVVDLRSSAVESLGISRNESEAGVVAVEGILSAIPVNVVIIHAEVASPFA